MIAYLIEGFGNGRLVGIASWLGYFAAIVIVCSMVAVSFGSYATSLFIGENAAAGWDNLFTTLIVSRWRASTSSARRSSTAPSR